MNHDPPVNPTTTNVPEHRLDEPWTYELEQLAKSWSEICETESKKHEFAGYITEKSHNRVGLITVFVPIVMGTVTTVIGILSPESIAINVVSTIGFGIAAIASAVYKWLNLGELKQLHRQYAAEYKTLARDIDYEVIREPKYRKPADTFMEEIRGRMKRFQTAAPPFPKGSSLFGCRKKSKFELEFETGSEMGKESPCSFCMA